MSLTFDEALKELDDDTRVTDEDGIEYTVGIDFGTVESVVEELRVMYAPTVEMTQNQKNAFDEAKRSLNTRDLAFNFGQEWTILDEVSGNVFGHGPGEMTNEQIETIMRVWLHPELIKVVDDVE